MNAYDAILARKSTRQFHEEQLASETLSKLLLAGNCAPVGRGQNQSIALSVVQTPKLLEEIRRAAQEKLGIPDALYGAPTLIVISSCGDPMLEHIEYANAACIIENIMIAATEMGLGCVYIWGAVTAIQERKDICAALCIEEGFRPVSAVALGYTDEPRRETYAQIKFSCHFV